MGVKLTSGNHIVLPTEAVDALGRPSHFDVTAEGGRLVLTPVRAGSAAALWVKLEALGLTDQDVTDAVAWARTTP